MGTGQGPSNVLGLREHTCDIETRDAVGALCCAGALPPNSIRGRRHLLGYASVEAGCPRSRELPLPKRPVRLRWSLKVATSRVEPASLDNRTRAPARRYQGAAGGCCANPVCSLQREQSDAACSPTQAPTIRTTWRCIVKRIGIPGALAILVSFSSSTLAADFSYSYLELISDMSKTENTAVAPLEEDAHGHLFGIAGSWEVSDSLYLKGAWSREVKDFRNEVARTPVDLDSRQTVFALGAGYHFDAGERTSLYAEALAIVDFEVEHRIPLVVPSRSGPPSVSTADSTIDGNGFVAALGVRHWMSERLQLEGQLSRTHTRADVVRTGDKISDSETMIRIGAHVHPHDRISVGAFLSFSKHTDDNFDNIRKLGVSLRYHF